MRGMSSMNFKIVKLTIKLRNGKEKRLTRVNQR